MSNEEISPEASIHFLMGFTSEIMLARLHQDFFGFKKIVQKIENDRSWSWIFDIEHIDPLTIIIDSKNFQANICNMYVLYDNEFGMTIFLKL